MPQLRHGTSASTRRLWASEGRCLQVVRPRPGAEVASQAVCRRKQRAPVGAAHEPHAPDEAMAAREATAQAAAATRDAATGLCAVAHQLRRAGYSAADVATILGVTTPRVYQLTTS